MIKKKLLLKVEENKRTLAHKNQKRLFNQNLKSLSDFFHFRGGTIAAMAFMTCPRQSSSGPTVKEWPAPSSHSRAITFGATRLMNSDEVGELDPISSRDAYNTQHPKL